MKYFLFSILIVICLPAYSQQLDTAACYVEIDTIEQTAYKITDGPWTSEGFYHSRSVVRDSIGIKIIKVMKMYYLFEGKRIYLPYTLREQIGGGSDIDLRIRYY